MSELINRPEYLNQLIQNKDVDLVKIVTGIISICLIMAYQILTSFI